MDRAAKGVQAAMTLLGQIFDLSPGNRREKCESLYRLAGEASHDCCIVELGTHHGMGTIALALGAGGTTVYTVDDYAPRIGWAGEAYGPDDEAEFLQNIARAGVGGKVVFCRGSVRRMAQDWRLHPSLIVWDLGIKRVLAGDFWAWEPHLAVGGTFAIHDTRRYDLGSNKLIAAAIAGRRFTSGRAWQGDIFTLVKKADRAA